METNNDKRRTDKPLIKSTLQFPVVGIGASAGGLDAFKKLLKAIPEHSGMAYVLVQHLHPGHESMLPEILQKVTKIPVLEISDDIKVLPDHIYIIPSNKVLLANDGVLLLKPRTASKNKHTLPIDLFFTSLAEVHQSRSIGVVLSGTASDGTKGLKSIKEQGGFTFAQSEDSAAYDGMPHSAIQAGVVDFILPPEEIPQKLLELIKITDSNDSFIAEDSPSSVERKEEEDIFRQILALLRLRKGTDFTYYKQTTIRRRLFRRMTLSKLQQPSDYLTFLRENKTEQDALYQDLLIPVTSFFRDTKSFAHLCETVFPQIIKNKKDGDPIRLWVAGCSTGQEVYSIAICIKEFLSSANYPGDSRGGPVQLFATDISEPAITKARSGIFTKNEVEELSAKRLNDFFTKTNGTYQINKSVRDMCVFAVHNFLKDPPFGKIDFLSCRNVLIYMEPYLQKKALTTFHYALNRGGFLLIGKSETISSVSDLFGITHKEDKLFYRKDAPGKFMLTANFRQEQGIADVDIYSKPDTEKPGRTNFQKTADDIILSRYTPAGVVVNEAMDIVHFRGKTGNFLEHLPGKPSHNLLKMAKEGLAFELRNILYKAKNEKISVIKENIPIDINGSLTNISIEALTLPDTVEPYYLVLFHHTQPQTLSFEPVAVSSTIKTFTSKLAAQSRIDQLENELRQLREDMRSITEDQEATNEELQSANEELLSGSEELQSLNEELETGKEELQSTNEELTVVNQELIALNGVATKARDYAESILTTIRQPMLVLDRNLRVKSGNNSFYKTFRVNEQETEGRLIYEVGNSQWNIPALRTLLEDILPKKNLFTDYELTHNFQDIGKRVMLLNAREIMTEQTEEKLILLAIEDVTDKVHARTKIEESVFRYQEMVYNSPSMIAILKGEDLIIELANDAILETWGKGKEVHGKPFFTLLPELIEQGYEQLIQEVYTTGKPSYGYEKPVYVIRDGKSQLSYYTYVHQAQRNKKGEIEGIAIIATEVTPQALLNNKIKESEAFSRCVLNNSPDCIKILDAEGRVLFMNDNGICLMEIDDFGKIKDHYWSDLWEEKNQQMIKDAISKALDGKKEQFQTMNPTTKGTPKWWDVIVAPILIDDTTKKVQRIISVSRDITEQKQNELKEKALLTRFQNLVYQAPVAICVLRGTDYVIETINEEMVLMWGRTTEQVLNKPTFEVLPELKEQGFRELLDGVYHTGERYVVQELPINLMRNGNLENAYVKFVYEPLREADGTISGVMALAHEITEQVLSRKKIEESEKQFSTLADNISQLAWMTDAQGWIYWYNQRWYDYTGTTLEEMQGWGWQKVHHTDLIEGVLARFKKAIASGKDWEDTFLLRSKEGEYRWFLSRALPIRNETGEIVQWFGTNTDVSVQREIQEALKYTKEQLELIFKNVPSAIYHFDKDGKILFLNEIGARQIGYNTVEEVLAEKDMFQLTKRLEETFIVLDQKGEPLPAGDSFAALSLRSGQPSEVVAQFIHRHTGSFFWILSKSSPLFNEKGELSIVLTTSTDITIQKTSEEVLRQSEERFRTLSESLPQLVWMTDAKGNYEYASHQWKNYSGLDPQDKRTWPVLVHADDMKPMMEAWADSLATGKTYRAEARLKSKEGEHRWHFVQGEPIKDEAGNILKWIGAFTDIHEQKTIAKKLEKLVAERTKALQRSNDDLQQFAHVTSHDLKEPIRKIRTFGGRLVQEFGNDLPEKAKIYVAKMESAANRAHAMIDGVLMYASMDGEMISSEPIDLNGIMGNIEVDLELLIAQKKAVIHYQDLPAIEGSSILIYQLFYNLINNALKFSKNEGIALINIVSESISSTDFKYYGLEGAHENYKKIIITDNGIGFSMEEAEKIFKTFSRLHSKDEYEGTGLGLALCKKITERHGGIILAKGKINEGASFEIILPVRQINKIINKVQ